MCVGLKHLRGVVVCFVFVCVRDRIGFVWVLLKVKKGGKQWKEGKDLMFYICIVPCYKLNEGIIGRTDNSRRVGSGQPTKIHKCLVVALAIVSSYWSTIVTEKGMLTSREKMNKESRKRIIGCEEEAVKSSDMTKVAIRVYTMGFFDHQVSGREDFEPGQAI